MLSLVNFDELVLIFDLVDDVLTILVDVHLLLAARRRVLLSLDHHALHVFLILASAFDDDLVAVDVLSWRSCHLRACLCLLVDVVFLVFAFTFTDVFAFVIRLLTLHVTESLDELLVVCKELLNDVTRHRQVVRVLLVLLAEIVPEDDFLVVRQVINVDQLVLLIIFAFTFAYGL